MPPIRYYLSIFLRRLPWFLSVSGVIGGLAIAVAMLMPPAYVSSVRLLVESSQIPGELAAPTVQVSAEERLQLFETRLLTRANMLDIARRLTPLPGQAQMNPDQIVGAMRARTSIRRSGGRNEATLMTMSFEAERAQTAATVLNEYLTLILQEDSQFRTERASQTQEFFQQEVRRPHEELEQQGARILAFQNANSDALPDSLNYRREQQNTLQTRLTQIERDVASLGEQRERLVQVFDATGRVGGAAGAQLTPQEAELERLRRELNNALLVYSETNPRVTALKGRVAQLEAQVLQDADTTAGTTDPARAMLDLQLAEIDSQVSTLTEQRDAIEQQLTTLADSIARTPANSIQLDALRRDYSNIQSQYNTATSRLATASTGERIELLSRGQRITVIEQPSVPDAPSKPNRRLIAGAGVLLGLVAGIGLIVLLEVLNNKPRRPVDLVRKLGVTPIATIPYLRTRGELVRRRTSLVAVTLVILTAIPTAIYLLHTFYMPLDLVADRIMNKIGFRG